MYVIPFVDELLARIDSRETAPWEEVRDEFISWLATCAPTVRDALRQHLADLPPDQVAGGRAGSRETTTHFTYPLAQRGNHLASVWVNEYKPASLRSSGYAHSVHNHRYDFTTTVLQGGYSYRSYVDAEPIPRFAGEGMLEQGDVLTVLHQDVHQVTAIEAGTYTLLVKSPERRPHSTSWDLSTGASRTHLPSENRWDRFVAGLNP